MTDWDKKAKNLLDTPVNCFSISGVFDNGQVADIKFTYNQVKYLTETIPPDHRITIHNDRFHEFGIDMPNSENIKFDRQSLMAMRHKNEFVDCIWIENHINKHDGNNQDLKNSILEKIIEKMSR